MITKAAPEQHDEINELFGPPQRAAGTGRAMREPGAPSWWHGDDEASQTNLIARTQAVGR